MIIDHYLKKSLIFSQEIENIYFVDNLFEGFIYINTLIVSTVLRLLLLLFRTHLWDRKINIQNNIIRYKPQDSILIDIDEKLNPFPNAIFPYITLDIIIEGVPLLESLTLK